MSFDHDEEDMRTDDSRARLLFESGDMGVRTGRSYPGALGSGEYAQRWRAVMGSSEEEHLSGLERQLQLAHPERHIRKWRRQPRSSAFSPNERLIGANQFREAYSAVTFANLQGAILDTHVTLNWRALGFKEDSDASEALHSEVIKHLRERSRYTKDDLDRPYGVWIYANERGANGDLHTHLLVFVPRERRPDFDAWLRTRVRRFSGLTNLDEALDISRARKDAHRALFHQWRQFGYLMKTVNPRESLPVFPGSTDTVPLTDLVPWAHESPGEVNCKIRLGIAHELRKPARTAAQYRSLLEEWGITDVRLIYGDYDYKEWEWQLEERRHAELDKETATFLLARVAAAREKANKEFESKYREWLHMVIARDKYLREAEEVRKAQLGAIGMIFNQRAGGALLASRN